MATERVSMLMVVVGVKKEVAWCCVAKEQKQPEQNTFKQAKLYRSKYLLGWAKETVCYPHR